MQILYLPILRELLYRIGAAKTAAVPQAPRKEHSCHYFFYLYKKRIFRKIHRQLECKTHQHYSLFVTSNQSCKIFFGNSSKLLCSSKVIMFGLIVTEESNFVDKFLYQISKNSFFLIGCIYRNGQSYIPRGNWKIQKNDQLFVLFPKEKLQSFEKNFGVSKKNYFWIFGTRIYLQN